MLGPINANLDTNVRNNLGKIKTLRKMGETAHPKLVINWRENWLGKNPPNHSNII